MKEISYADKRKLETNNNPLLIHSHQSSLFANREKRFFSIGEALKSLNFDFAYLERDNLREKETREHRADVDV